MDDIERLQLAVFSDIITIDDAKNILFEKGYTNVELDNYFSDGVIGIVIANKLGRLELFRLFATAFRLNIITQKKLIELFTDFGIPKKYMDLFLTCSIKGIL